MGHTQVYRESLDTSLLLARDVLSKMGYRKYTLNNQLQNFRKYDEESLKRLAQEPKRDEKYKIEAGSRGKGEANVDR